MWGRRVYKDKTENCASGLKPQPDRTRRDGENKAEVKVRIQRVPFGQVCEVKAANRDLGLLRAISEQRELT